MDLWGIKELYDVTLKATYPIEMGNRTIEKGEIVLAFDNIQIGGFQEQKQFIHAQGGFENRKQITWETTKEIPFVFTQGVFSIEHLSLLSNSKLLNIKENTTPIIITKREQLESNDIGEFVLEQVPVGKIFVYNKETGEKLEFTASGKTLKINQPYLDLYVAYEYEYLKGGKIIEIGNRLLNGFLKLEAKTRLKEDTNGHVVTGIIEIPKLKLMSDLSMRLGKEADPAIVNFKGSGYPVGTRGRSYVCHFITLNDDVDAYM